jgi:hypothetical protein
MLPQPIRPTAVTRAMMRLSGRARNASQKYKRGKSRGQLRCAMPSFDAINFDLSNRLPLQYLQILLPLAQPIRTRTRKRNRDVMVPRYRRDRAD